MLPKSLSAVVLAALLSAPAVCAPSNPLTGSIAGIVANAFGVPQMGATVMLFNRLDRQVGRLLTDDKGSFQFDSLPADLYSIRISLSSFMPALRERISVQPGMRRILSINLAGVLSSIELVYSLPVQQGLMSEDWKWTLRSSSATRPILRFLPQDMRDPQRQLRANQSWFSQTRGVVNLSAGDSTTPVTLGSQPDLGTAFALATSFRGATSVAVSGNLGYSSASGVPTAGFRTTLSRQVGDSRTPEVSVTMRQMFLPGRGASGIFSGQQEALPQIRTMAVSVSDHMEITDNIQLQYGATLESVTFLQRLNYLSPFARLSWDLESLGVVEFGFSSGLPPMQLYANAGTVQSDDQRQQISQLSMFPRVSLREGQARVQRAQNFELGYRKQVGSRIYSAAAYRESLSNAALTAVGADGLLANGDMIPDLFSTASIINAGGFTTVGYMASVQQTLRDDVSLTLAYGNSGVLEATQDRLDSNEAGALRHILKENRRHWATTRFAARAPWTGTHFATSYQFMNGRAVTPGHYFVTQSVNPGRGLNLQVRQPIPGLNVMPGKLEATAEIRNILAQGYQPVTLATGQTIQLVHSPRALRGGLAFVF
ncbi:MAG: TonB-dependent receptor [Candidatus Solibacter usitatus]|nr:TonB-dependent receptor [Candidatus Solibacter usitatus]